MNLEEHLNQFKTLLSKTMVILDWHTTQLKQHTLLLDQLTTVANKLLTAVERRDDNIIFLLQEQAEFKTQWQYRSANGNAGSADSAG